MASGPPLSVLRFTRSAYHNEASSGRFTSPPACTAGNLRRGNHRPIGLFALATAPAVRNSPAQKPDRSLLGSLTAIGIRSCDCHCASDQVGPGATCAEHRSVIHWRRLFHRLVAAAVFQGLEI